MKLNIGCGRSYKRGYVNIDAFDNTVADHIMSVLDMSFDDHSVSHIDCIQVIEHLGLAQSIYALAEMYRVLRPEGTLLLETPDLLTAFKSFGKANIERRKLLLNWIYGIDSPGMAHRYGFPEALLQLILEECGFEKMESVRTHSRTVNPNLRIICRKGDSPLHQGLAHFRKRLANEKLVDINNQADTIEKEELIQQLVKIVMKGEIKNSSILAHIVETSATTSPTIGRTFIAMLSSRGIVGSEGVDTCMAILDDLDCLCFPRVLVHLFMEMPIVPGKQQETMQSVTSMARQIARKLLKGEKSAIETLSNLPTDRPPIQSTNLFSQTILEDQSRILLAKGIRGLANGDLQESEETLRNAIRLDRDSVVAFWNLAKTYALLGKEEKASAYFKTTRDLLMAKVANSQKLVHRVDRELVHLRSGALEGLSEPVYDLR